MAGPDPAIHAFCVWEGAHSVDARIEPGHDGFSGDDGF
jgi:hypothetical protein